MLLFTKASEEKQSKHKLVTQQRKITATMSGMCSRAQLQSTANANKPAVEHENLTRNRQFVQMDALQRERWKAIDKILIILWLSD